MPWRSAAMRFAESAGDVILRKPTTGNTGFGACVVGGHCAAAPRKSVINSRRLIVSVLKPRPYPSTLLRGGRCALEQIRAADGRDGSLAYAQSGSAGRLGP